MSSVEEADDALKVARLVAVREHGEEEAKAGVVLDLVLVRDVLRPVRVHATARLREKKKESEKKNDGTRVLKEEGGGETRSVTKNPALCACTRAC